MVAADGGSHWVEGVYDVYLLNGNCYINQGLTYARSQQAVIWIERGGKYGDPPHKVIAYLEGNVEINLRPDAGKATGGTTLKDRNWFGRFYSALPIDVRPIVFTPPPQAKPDIYARAAAKMGIGPPVINAVVASPAKAGAAGGANKAQFAEPIAPPPAIVAPPTDMIRIRVQNRSHTQLEAEARQIENTNQWVAIIKSGVNIVVDGLDDFGSIDVDTDNLIIWTEGQLQSTADGHFQPKDRPLEIYMEGNVIFRQGETTIHAQRMYYDVRRETGIVLGTELLSPVKDYEGTLRLRADVLQMIGRGRFIAQNASLTSSRMGEPGYDLRSQTITYDDVQRPRINPFTQMPEVNESGEPIIDHDRLATSRNNFVYVEQFPVFYWPFLASNLEQPNFFVESVAVRSDKVFGQQILTNLNAYQLLNIKNPPKRTDWTFSTDYFSKRGPALGTTFNYEGQSFLGIPNSTTGFLDMYGIQDHGLDNLGLERRTVPPEKDTRGRILWQHRQILPSNFQVTGQVGLISDFNFLEQWFEREYDQLSDQLTDVELKQFNDNSTWSAYASVRLNPFFTETEWLPRLDHFLIGQPLLDDKLTWYEHSNIGYGRFRTANPPTDPTQAALWGPLPWESPASAIRVGERLATRHEIDMPFELGPVKFNPYMLGELARWGQVLDYTDENRAYGALGLRASTTMWTVDPTVRSDMFNVNGIAHKVVFDADVFYAQSTQNLSTLPLYDQIDDNNIEAYRRWFPFFDFGGAPPVPLKYDERYYALRRGMGSYVASPSTEIADDLFTTRLGVRQRWQTKRGPAGNQHVIDWISLDTDCTLFPDPNRDNFGQVLGLVDYNFRWHAGDRTTVVSDGYFDFFDQAPKYFTVGGFLNRPPRGSIYMGFHALEGPITSNVLAFNYSYRMSPKWLSSFGTTYDFYQARNIGQNITLTRIGESFLFTLNVNVDTSKGNVGANIAIQPRFLQGRLGAPSAVAIPVAGVYGLE